MISVTQMKDDGSFQKPLESSWVLKDSHVESRAESSGLLEVYRKIVSPAIKKM